MQAKPRTKASYLLKWNWWYLNVTLQWTVGITEVNPSLSIQLCERLRMLTTGRTKKESKDRISIGRVFVTARCSSDSVHVTLSFFNNYSSGHFSSAFFYEDTRNIQVTIMVNVYICNACYRMENEIIEYNLHIRSFRYKAYNCVTFNYRHL